MKKIINSHVPQMKQEFDLEAAYKALVRAALRKRQVKSGVKGQ